MPIDREQQVVEQPEPTRLLLTGHERIRHASSLLLRLDIHLIHYGVDEETQAAARSIMRCFDVEVPLHREDEERDLFPALRELGRSHIAKSLDDLKEEYDEIADMWQPVRDWLETIRRGRLPARLKLLGSFAERYPAYADREERQVYSAIRRLTKGQIHMLSESMQQRRAPPK